jgi:hypothetical protein
MSSLQHPSEHAHARVCVQVCVCVCARERSYLRFPVAHLSTHAPGVGGGPQAGLACDVSSNSWVGCSKPEKVLGICKSRRVVHRKSPHVGGVAQ